MSDKFSEERVPRPEFPGEMSKIRGVSIEGMGKLRRFVKTKLRKKKVEASLAVEGPVVRAGSSLGQER